MKNSEIDRLVADHVMGWSIHGFELNDKISIIAETGNGNLIVGSEFSPSTILNDAWMVVEKLKEEKLFTIIDINYENYAVNIYRLDLDAKTVSVSDSYADTLQLAICLAALDLKCIEVQL